MNIHWQNLLTKILLWFIAELALNATGLDQLANYSEYMQYRNTVVYSAAISTYDEPNPTANLNPCPAL
jgi:hypothetical protein